MQQVVKPARTVGDRQRRRISHINITCASVGAVWRTVVIMAQIAMFWWARDKNNAYLGTAKMKQMNRVDRMQVVSKTLCTVPSSSAAHGSWIAN